MWRHELNMAKSNESIDFAHETELLGLIGDKRTDNELKLDPLPFENMSAYSEFYRTADEGFRKERVVRKSGSPNYDRINSFHDLPPSSDYHIRGLVEGTKCITIRKKRDDGLMRTRTVPPYTFHSQPSCDVPTNGDLFDFLKYSHLRHVVVGPSQISILDKTRHTLDLSLELWKWEQANLYKRTRIERRHKEKPDTTSHEIRERYAKLALKGIGLRWPYRVHQVRRNWPAILNEFGIAVSQVVVTEPTRLKSESVLQLLKGTADEDDVAKWHGVSVREVRIWVKEFTKAGSKALDR